MAWSLKFNTKYKLVELTYTGIVSATDLKEAFVEAASLATAKSTTLFLTDCTQLKGGHSITDLYSYISLYEENHVHKMKEALVIPSQKWIKEYAEFYETACLNRGFKVKLFSNAGDGIAWLIS